MHAFTECFVPISRQSMVLRRINENRERLYEQNSQRKMKSMLQVAFDFDLYLDVPVTSILMEQSEYQDEGICCQLQLFKSRFYQIVGSTYPIIGSTFLLLDHQHECTPTLFI
nr:uncharacterized protein LOC104089671 [Nicotiana tomentosiformis]